MNVVKKKKGGCCFPSSLHLLLLVLLLLLLLVGEMSTIGASFIVAAFVVPHHSPAWTKQQKQQKLVVSPSSSSSRVASLGSSSSSSSSLDDILLKEGEPPPSFFSSSSSWLTQLSSETGENLERSLEREGIITGESGETSTNINQRKRPVFNGHYVLVEPTPLENPRLVLVNHNLTNELFGAGNGSDEWEKNESFFLNWFSGNLPTATSSCWATPYAKSVLGERKEVGPFEDYYGDGRAISIGQVCGVELQLKGAGKTPFCRTGDGRCVFRSSCREFLASEAMFALRVPTTRALSLIVSDSETVERPWYTDETGEFVKSTSLISKLLSSNAKQHPTMMIREPTAIVCRVAQPGSSFIRIGHIDLFARRVQRIMESEKDSTTVTESNEWKELKEIVWHACYREFKTTAYDPYYEADDIVAACKVLLEQSSEAIATMVAQWIRVGFSQGNFHADNGLVGGATMDYGPFGFVEEFDPNFCKWTSASAGSGNNKDGYGFWNQPKAAIANYQVLVESVVPLIVVGNGDDSDNHEEDSEARRIVKEYVTMATNLLEAKVSETLRAKIGLFNDENEEVVGDRLWKTLKPLLQTSKVDWTIFFRELTYTVRDFPLPAKDKSSATTSSTAQVYDDNDNDNVAAVKILKALEADNDDHHPSPFYKPLTKATQQDWISWIQSWRDALSASGIPQNDIYDQMKMTNPKYVLREWMLVNAYTSASSSESKNGDESELINLYKLIQNPYEEGTDEEINKYYRRAPNEALTMGGTAFMS